MKLKILVVTFIILKSFLNFGQNEIQDSTNTANTIDYLQYNTIDHPANAGIQGRNFSLVTFSNLPNSSFTEIHNSVSVDSYINQKKDLALGVYYKVNNWSNLFYENNLGLVVKKRIKNLNVGIAFERRTLSTDSSVLIFGDMINPQQGITSSSNDYLNKTTRGSVLNIKPSIIYNLNKLKIGLSIHHLTQEGIELISPSTPTEILFNISYRFNIRKKWSYVPFIFYHHIKNSPQLEIHNLLIFNDVRKNHFFDFYYTNQNSVSFKYGINFNNRFKFYGNLNTPINFNNYFPLSVQAGLQYAVKTKIK